MSRSATGASWGSRTPYLEERLRLARDAAKGLEDSIHVLAERSATLESTIETLESELDRATDEVEFLREADTSEAPPSPFRRPPGGPAGFPAPSSSARPAGGRGAVIDPARYREFTIGRYNATMAETKSRRRATGWLTVGAAAGISAALLLLTLLAREPEPPVWLAILPVIWMIPVPFFLLSFRGTNRVLRRNHLDLAGAR